MVERITVGRIENEELIPKPEPPPKPVERLFPFALRAGILMVGRERLWNSRSKLHFLLITTDLSESSAREILKDYAAYPVVRRYTSEEVERHFKLKGTKVVAFSKSTLAKEIYAGLKEYRLNKPPREAKSGEENPPGEIKVDPASSGPAQSK